MGLNKIVELDEHFSGSRGLEPTVQLIDFNTKTASEASDWSRSIRPVPGKTYILVLAMGASEFYGPNRNGDAFRETELKKCHKTFETNAHVFKSHVNKDPEKIMSFIQEKVPGVKFFPLPERRSEAERDTAFYFEFDKSNLTDESMQMLREITEAFAEIFLLSDLLEITKPKKESSNKEVEVL